MRASMHCRTSWSGSAADVGEEALDAVEDLVEDAVVDRLGHPPRRLRLEAVAEHVAVVVEERRRAPRSTASSRRWWWPPSTTTSTARAEQRGDLGVARTAARRCRRGPLLDVAVVEHLDRRRASPSATASPARRRWSASASQRRGAGRRGRPQPLGEHLAGQEVALHELAEAAADLVLALGDDRRVRDRQPERVAEQRGDGEPVGERADHRRLGDRPDVADPARPVLLVRPGDDVHDRGGGTSSPVANGLHPPQVAEPVGSRVHQGADIGRSRHRRRSASCRASPHAGTPMHLKHSDGPSAGELGRGSAASSSQLGEEADDEREADGEGDRQAGRERHPHGSLSSPRRRRTSTC